MNTISKEKSNRITTMLRNGYKIREICHLVGVSKNTVQVRKHRYEKGIQYRKNRRDTPYTCDFCGETFLGEREYHRKRPRSKHKFCGIGCSGAYRTMLRSDDRCKRCDIRRGDIFPACFTRGMCGYCYGLLRSYSFDEQQAQAHELTQTLKKETKNVKDQNHRRPTQDAHRDNRERESGDAGAAEGARHCLALY